MIISFKIQRPVIGIVGGVGPYAGLDLNRKIFDNTVTNGTDQDHLEVILYSTGNQVTDRTDWLLYGTGESPAMGLFDALRAVRDAGATVAAIACNTAHSLRIMQPLLMMLEQGEVNIDMVDMIDETGLYINENFVKKSGPAVKIGLLSTRGTLETRIYDRLEFDYPGKIELVMPNRDTAAALHRAIYDREWGIKARSNPVTERAREECLRALETLALSGARAVVLGCTELPLALPETKAIGVSLIDPATITARALISRVAPHKLLPLPQA
jgi:aspartate racemase